MKTLQLAVVLVSMIKKKTSTRIPSNMPVDSLRRIILEPRDLQSRRWRITSRVS